MNSIAKPVQPPRVLLVDDDPALLAGLSRILRRQCILPDCCENADEAWQRLQSLPYDVICTDQHMPGTSGVELLAHCATTYPSLRRILMTGSATLDTVLSAINSGQVHHVLRKPVGQQEMINTLLSAARASRTDRLARVLLQRCRQRELQLYALGAAPEIARPEEDDYLPDQLPDDFDDLLALESSNEHG